MCILHSRAPEASVSIRENEGTEAVISVFLCIKGPSGTALRRAVALTAGRIHKSHRAERGRRELAQLQQAWGNGKSRFSLWGGEGLGRLVRSPCKSAV